MSISQRMLSDHEAVKAFRRTDSASGMCGYPLTQFDTATGYR